MLAIVLIVWLIIKGAKSKKLKNNISVLETSHTSMFQKLEKANLDVIEANTKLEMEISEHAKLTAEYDEEITKKDETIKTLEDHVAELESRIATQANTIEQNKTYIDEIREDYYELQDKLNAEQNQRAALKKNYEDMQTMYTQVDTTMKLLQKGLKDTIENANVAMKNSSELNEKNKEYLGRIHELESEVKKLKGYEEENSALVTTIRKLAGMSIEGEAVETNPTDSMSRKELFVAAKKAGLPNVTCLSTEKIRELVKEALKNK